MKKIVLLAILISLTVISTQAQVEVIAFQDSLTLSLPKVELNAGDYMIKASKNVTVGLVLSVLSGVFFTVSGLSSIDRGEQTILQVFGAGTGIGALSQVICFPINLNKAGKAYKREQKLKNIENWEAIEPKEDTKEAK